MGRIILLCFVIAVGVNDGLGQTPSRPLPVKFEPILLAVDANEGVAIADVNQDKNLDIIAGRNWYAGPDFKPRPLRNIEDWNGYVQSNGDQAFDVNGDGWVDVVAGSFLPSQIHWYENPGADGLKLGQLWKQHLLVDTKISQNEMCFLRDFDGDGKPEWIFNSWNKNNPVVAWRFVEDPKPSSDIVLKPHVLGNEGHGHGMGFGDINNDGREDILVAGGWYECPAEKPLESGPWKFHADWSLAHASCPILVRDLDGDGRNDLVWGSGHDYGVFWWKSKGADEKGKLQFDVVVIDEQYSQAHAVHFADLDGDGVEELITGKRVRGHNGGDPGAKEMPCMYYYRWNKDKKSFDRFPIEEGHVGIGLQIRSADLDGDGDLDLAVAGKDGTWFLRNLGSEDSGR